MGDDRPTRRSFLRLSGAAAAGLAVFRRTGSPTAEAAGAHRRRPGTTVSTGTTRRWSDPATWGGSVPGPGSVAVVQGTVVLDVDAKVAGVTIPAGSTLLFDPARSVTLRSTGNVTVEGTLQMRPASDLVTHTLIFDGVDESRFVGGGMEPLASDVGLWVPGAGTLDIAGARKLAWTRAEGAVDAGAAVITLADDPVGWRAGDVVVITPTPSPAKADHHDRFDVTTVTAIAGRIVTLATPTRYAHPRVSVGRGVRLAAEVLNLTRNVRIEGTPGGRAHIWVRSSRLQGVAFAAIRHVGPRKRNGSFSDPVLGRYGLHFHHSNDGTRGSLVEGVVIRDAGNHAFVPHGSHGITMRDCVSYDTYEDAYWWDGPPASGIPGDRTHDLLWERCVAARVLADPAFRGFRLSGFTLGAGNGNTARDCVATGVAGTDHASGFHWRTEPVNTEGNWTFTGGVAHNNARHGIFTWQNTSIAHVVRDFVCYHNGGAGIAHGSYSNPYVYRDAILYGNALAAVELHAVSNRSDPAGAPMSFINVHCDAAGLSSYSVVTARHIRGPGLPTLFDGCTFTGYSRAAVGCVYEGDTFAEHIDVVDCTFGANEFWLALGVHPDTRVRVQDATHGALRLTRAGTVGIYKPEWNAAVMPIAPFA